LRVESLETSTNLYTGHVHLHGRMRPNPQNTKSTLCVRKVHDWYGIKIRDISNLFWWFLSFTLLHFVLSFSISYWDLIKFPYFTDTTKRGVRGWKEVQRQGDFADSSIVVHTCSCWHSLLEVCSRMYFWTWLTYFFVCSV